MAATAESGGGPSAPVAGEEEPPLGLDSLVEEAAATAAASAGFRLTAVRREPAVRLQHGVSGLEPLAWSEDHRVSVSTARSIAVLEQLSDVHGGGQEMVIHRTAVPAPGAACLLKVSGCEAPRAVRGRGTERLRGRTAAPRIASAPTLRAASVILSGNAARVAVGAERFPRFSYVPHPHSTQLRLSISVISQCH